MLKRKRIKQAAGILAAVSMLFCNVYGSGYGFQAAFQGNSLSVSYEMDDVGNGTMIYIFDTAVAEDGVIDEALLNSHLVYAGKAENKGVSVQLSDNAVYGTYTVIFGSAGLPSDKAGRMIYAVRVTETVKNEATTAILGASDPDAALAQITQYNGVAYQVDLTNAEAQKQLIYDLIQENGISDVTAMGEILAQADAIYTMASLNQADLVQALKDNQTILDLDSDIETYAAETAAFAVSRQGEFAASLAAAKQAAKESLALAALNGAPNSQVIPVIEKYGTIFGITTLPSNLTSANEYAVSTILEGITFTTVASVSTELANAIVQASNTGGSAGGSSGGGGGGGGYSGGGSSASYSGSLGVPSVSDKELQEQIREEYGASGLISFSDIQDYGWATDAISYVSNHGIMTGSGDGTFRPGDSITREEYVKVIIEAVLDGALETSALRFEDVEDAWYKPYIETAVAKQIIKGISETEFGVGKKLTRQDAAVILVRGAEVMYKTLNKAQTLVDFSDYDTVADYAKVSVDMLARAQIISGFEDGSFRPEETVTRAQVAKIIYAYHNNINQ